MQMQAHLQNPQAYPAILILQKSLHLFRFSLRAQWQLFANARKKGQKTTVRLPVGPSGSLILLTNKQATKNKTTGPQHIKTGQMHCTQQPTAATADKRQLLVSRPCLIKRCLRLDNSGGPALTLLTSGQIFYL